MPYDSLSKKYGEAYSLYDLRLIINLSYDINCLLFQISYGYVIVIPNKLTLYMS